MARQTVAIETASNVFHVGPQSGFLHRRPVDLVHLAMQTQGNRELETEVLGLFLRQSMIQLARIAGAASPKACFEAAHHLKGSARAIGASGVAECAEAIEAAATDGADIAAPLADLNRAVTVANSFIRDLID